MSSGWVGRVCRRLYGRIVLLFLPLLPGDYVVDHDDGGQ